MIRQQWLNTLWITGAVTLLATQPVIARITPQKAVPLYSPARFLAVGSTVSRVQLNVFTVQSKRPEILDSLDANSQLLATRCLTKSIGFSPRSVAVIKRNQIQQQAILTRNLGRILGQLVPGLSPLTPSSRRAGLFLRGRRVEILLDGVPIGVGSSAVLSGIDPKTIEQIEVIRGSSLLCRV